jgi:cGMP-dependent protein kinase
LHFRDLELHRVVGTGQFGLVRLVRHRPTGQAFALKVVAKAPLTEGKQVEHVLNERAVAGSCDHPFLVRLAGAYQDAAHLYLLQEWVPGGELFHHLDVEGSFSDAAARFYAANVVVALQRLHSRGIVYRDLKPENLLLDELGYVKMADFGFAKVLGTGGGGGGGGHGGHGGGSSSSSLGGRTFTICGTPDYQAPEVIMRRGTTVAADYWALGVLVFEMLVGDPPFKSVSADPWDTFRRALSGRFYVPHFISEGAADLIFRLLQVNPERRLGGAGSAEAALEVRRHRWFAGFDWEALERRELVAPILPRLAGPLDTSNFDAFDDAAAVLEVEAGGGAPVPPAPAMAAAVPLPPRSASALSGARQQRTGGGGDDDDGGSASSLSSSLPAGAAAALADGTAWDLDAWEWVEGALGEGGYGPGAQGGNNDDAVAAMAM